MEGTPDLTLLQDHERLGAYLMERGMLAPAAQFTVEPLGGGVSNRIVLLHAAGRSFVVKQSQPKLAVQEDWFAPIDRILIEADCMQALAGLLPAGTVPHIYFIDRERYLYAMEAAPAGSVLWKAELMQGLVEDATAVKVGEILAAMHSGTEHSEVLRQRFWENRILHALRIDPCFTFLADVHPELAASIHERGARLDHTKRCLVHGDYTPKNMLRSGERLILLDYEIAHWGDPALDSGFLIAHLMLKAIHFPAWSGRLIQAARAFWAAYARQQTFADPDELEAGTADLVPFLILARIDSKSPVEYITPADEKQFARDYAAQFIMSPTRHLEELWGDLITRQAAG